MRRVTIVLVAAGLLAGCGGRAEEQATDHEAAAADPAVVASSSTVAPPVAAAPPSTIPVPETVPPEAASAAGAPSPDPTPIRQAPAPKDAAEPFLLEVDAPSCAQQGEVIEVVVMSEPDVDVAMIIGFSDGGDHGTTNIGTTDTAGRYETTMTIRPDAPTGDARLLAAAGTTGNRGDAKERPLEIVEVGESCG